MRLQHLGEVADAERLVALALHPHALAQQVAADRDDVPAARRATDRARIGSYLARLSQITGHPIGLTDAAPNFWVYIVSEDERETMGPLIQAALPGLSPTDVAGITAMPRSTYCLVYALAEGSTGSYTRAFAVIRAEHPDLLRLDVGIFILHAILMASFVALPLAFVERGGLPKEEHWWVYLTALFISFFAMVPFIIYGEKKRKMKRVLAGAVSVLLLVEVFFWQWADNLRGLVIGTVVFFTAFNLLEASLPSLVSKVSPAGGKGTAMGVYSTSQFLGAALGGILGGWLFQHGGLNMVFLGCAALCAVWLVVALRMNEPPYVTSLRMPLTPEAVREAGLTERLMAVPGVTDAVVVAEEAAIYIKLDTKILDRTTLERLVNPASSACEA